jgi:hypothetical protein
VDKIRVVLADDHQEVIATIRAVLVACRREFVTALER